MLARPRYGEAARLFITNACLGVVVGCLFSGGVLLTDAFAILTLIRSDSDPLVPALVFALGSISSFVPLVIASAMALSE